MQQTFPAPRGNPRERLVSLICQQNPELHHREILGQHEEHRLLVVQKGELRREKEIGRDIPGEKQMEPTAGRQYGKGIQAHALPPAGQAPGYHTPMQAQMEAHQDEAPPGPR